MGQFRSGQARIRGEREALDECQRPLRPLDGGGDVDILPFEVFGQLHVGHNVPGADGGQLLPDDNGLAPAFGLFVQVAQTLQSQLINLQWQVSIERGPQCLLGLVVESQIRLPPSQAHLI